MVHCTLHRDILFPELLPTPCPCRLNFQKVSRYFLLSPAIKSIVSSCSSKQKTTGLQLNLSRHAPGLLCSHRNQHMPTVAVKQNCEHGKFLLSWSETCPGSCPIQCQTPQMPAQGALHVPSHSCSEDAAAPGSGALSKTQCQGSAVEVRDCVGWTCIMEVPWKGQCSDSLSS